MFFYYVVDTVWIPGISLLKHEKKCVFGVFLNLTRISLVRKNSVIDIAMVSGARGAESNHRHEDFQ